jgi:hypothetical protein
MPNRYLREEIITSRWNKCSWMAQSLYIRLLGLVCDFGRYEADPTVLCAQAFPTYPHFRRRTVEKLLCELAENGLILLYTVEGKPYLQILRWRERVRTLKSRYPRPAIDENSADAGNCVPSPSEVTYRPLPERRKESLSQPSLPTDVRPDAVDCLPSTPKALEPTPKPPPRRAGGGGGFYKPGSF